MAAPTQSDQPIDLPHLHLNSLLTAFRTISTHPALWLYHLQRLNPCTHLSSYYALNPQFSRQIGRKVYLLKQKVCLIQIGCYTCVIYSILLHKIRLYTCAKNMWAILPLAFFLKFAKSFNLGIAITSTWQVWSEDTDEQLCHLLPAYID